MNFDELGHSSIKDSSSFKKIQFFSKTNTESIFNIKSDFESNYYRMSSLYNTDLSLMASLSYGISRQHNYNSLISLNKSLVSALDKNSVDKFFTYNLNTEQSTTVINDNSDISNLKHYHTPASELTYNLDSLISDNSNKSYQTFNTHTTYPSLNSFINLETDSKQTPNTFKYGNNSVLKKKKTLV